MCNQLCKFLVDRLISFDFMGTEIRPFHSNCITVNTAFIIGHGRFFWRPTFSVDIFVVAGLHAREMYEPLKARKARKLREESKPKYENYEYEYEYQYQYE